jgi:hypothetical protein
MSDMRAFAFAAAVLCVPVAAGANESHEHLSYRVHHQLWGDIGMLTRDIARDEAMTTVETKIDVHVSLLGIALHDAHGTWREVWQGGRLQAVDATTHADGALEITRGSHEGNAFVIRAGSARIEAPADVQPVNPWSLQFVRATTLMSLESGRLMPAAVRDIGMESRALAGATALLHHYLVEADGVHHLYFDGTGRLVQVEFTDITGKATITLVPAASRVARGE